MAETYNDDDNIIDTLRETDVGMVFPTIDTVNNNNQNISQLKIDAMEFITSTILKHEKYFYDIINKTNKANLKSILGSYNATIMTMITTTTDHFYNTLYMDIQNNVESPLTLIIKNMATLGDYGPHIILDKLYKLTINCHYDISRDELVINSGPEKLEERVLMQINTYFATQNIIDIFEKYDDDDIPFAIMKDGQVAFKAEFKSIN